MTPVPVPPGNNKSPASLHTSGGHRLPHPPGPDPQDPCLHSDDWQWVRLLHEELVRVSERQAALQQDLRDLKSLLEKTMSSLYGGSTHLSDSMLIRLSALEKHVAQQVDGTQSTRSIRTALLAAVVGAITSGVVVTAAQILTHR